jgi:GAF domain-containing protein
MMLQTLERLLAISTADMRAAFDAAATLLAEVFGADKVDVFLYEPAHDTLAAIGTSDTPVGRLQRALGLDRLPRSGGGLAVAVFEAREARRIDHADADPTELRAIVEKLGIRSELLAPVASAGQTVRGVLGVTSQIPARFDDGDLAFARAAAGWVGLLLDRAELAAGATAEAERRGRRSAADELAKLTRREQDVAAAIAEGLSNAEVGQRLVIEEGTAANHVRRILLKLKLTSRTQLAVWAVERGLYRSEWAEEQQDD